MNEWKSITSIYSKAEGLYRLVLHCIANAAAFNVRRPDQQPTTAATLESALFSRALVLLLPSVQHRFLGTHS